MDAADEWRYKLGVRCYEGNGTSQPTKEEPNFPSGAAGLHFVAVTAR